MVEADAGLEVLGIVDAVARDSGRKWSRTELE